ncbi:hypothetical protein CALCODRAFT_268901 [Calocera cornea HHB12733]|uniref:Uncharacterized protein n=1 Tax=Calocera cornea HHB12733 TaxID=1353952 RepID=A0A165G7V7_9BASI|nr:hypothetical protein CALCODRAFT_268901 [Calocera cornea HHB12733]
MRLDDIPDVVLDAIVASSVTSSPWSTAALLSSSSRLRCSTLRAIFSTIVIPDDARHTLRSGDDAYLPLRRGPASAFLADPETYGPFVKTLKVVDPTIFLKEATPANSLFYLAEEVPRTVESSQTSTPVPLSAQTVDTWLQCIPMLQEFTWSSGSLPPDGICETLVSHNNKLQAFTYMPSVPVLPAPAEKTATSGTRSGPAKWDAPSLLHLAQLVHLRKLAISRLSQSGSRTLSHLLRLCASSEADVTLHEDTGIDELTIDVLWFDEDLCDAIANLSKLKTLTIGTAGTTLRDRGLQKLLEGESSLKHLVLREVEGRISRSFWSSAILPPTLKSFTLSMSESGPHHSWAADHLPSLANLSLSQLQSVRVTRTLTPLYDMHMDTPVDDVGRWPGNPIPPEVVDSFKGTIKVLECDWWLWKLDDLRTVIERCLQLEVIKIALDAPFTRIFSLIPTLSNLRNLRVLSLCVPAGHAPQSPIPKDASIWCPPSPVTPVIPYPLPTPTASPVKRGAYTTIRLPEPPTPPMESSPVAVTSPTDPALPSPRDVKKLAKKCDKLEILEWYGHSGRGSWSIDREPAIKVSFQESDWPTDELVERVRWEQVVTAAGWKPEPREGQTWVESAWILQELDKEKERKLEKEREIEREKQRQLEKAEKKREQDRQKNEGSAPSPITSVLSISPVEEQLRTQFPLPSVTRLSKQKSASSKPPSSGSCQNSNGSKPRGSSCRGPSSPNSARRGSGRGRGQGSPGSTRFEKPLPEGGSSHSRRTSTGGGRGTGRGRGKQSTRGRALRV